MTSTAPPQTFSEQDSSEAPPPTPSEDPLLKSPASYPFHPFPSEISLPNPESSDLASPAQPMLLFDFDGTLADTRTMALEILNELAEEFRFSPIAQEELPNIRHNTIPTLMKELGVSKWRLPFLTQRGIKKMKGRINQVSPIEGIPQLLHQLQEGGWKLGIVTSNSVENVTTFLKQHQLEYFSLIKSCSKIFGKGTTLRQLIKKEMWDPQKLLYIGDEVRDIEASQSALIPIVAVSWGYNSPESLQAKNPIGLLHHPKELIDFLLKYRPGSYLKDVQEL